MRLSLFLCSFLAAALAELSDTGFLGVSRVQNITELTPSLLQSSEVVFVKDDNSFIVAASAPATANKAPYRFVQTRIHGNMTTTMQNKFIPTEGCFDNRLSETESVISRSIERVLAISGGPEAALNLVAVELGVSASLGNNLLQEERMICAVGPGEMLQFHRQVTRTTVAVKERRHISIDRSSLGVDSIRESDWEAPGPELDFVFISATLACVTQEDLLRCPMEG